MKRKFLFVPFVAMVGVAAIFAACGDDDDDATNTPAATTAAATASPSGGDGPTLAEAETFMEELIATYNAGEFEEFLAFFSDDALLSFTGDDPGTSREDAIAGVLEQLGAEVNLRTVTEEGSTDDSITVLVESDDGNTVALESFTIEQAGADGQVTAFERLTPELPDDYTAVLVEGTEFQYIFDETEITDGNLALDFSNIGSQFHELYLLQIEEGTPLQDVVDEGLAVEDPSILPPVFLADLGPVFAGPGAPPTRYLRAEPFEAGRYLMICFIPDQDVPEGEEGEPHAALGMFAEFTIAE